MTTFKKGSGLLIANILLFITVLIATVLLEKIFPVAQQTYGIENSNKAYYGAQSATEEMLLQIQKRNPFTLPTVSSTGYAAIASSDTTVIPAPGEGNSDYDQNYNKISPTDAVQIAIRGSSLADLSFEFRIPDLNGDGIYNETLSGGYYAGTQSGLITWNLSDNQIPSHFLVPFDDAQIIHVNAGLPETLPFGWFNGRKGTNEDGNSGLVSTFFTSFPTPPSNRPTAIADSSIDFPGSGLGGCLSPTVCFLRLSMIRPLISGSGQIIPYLEYRITNGTTVLPDRFLKITSVGKSYGFQQEIVKKLPQVTGVQGMDITLSN